jgi:RHS repeat-associated protein
VTSGKKYWSDSTPAAGQQFGYSFDDIGNRTQAQSGGNDLGVGLRTANYSANNLNQYESRTVPGAVDIIGTATNSAIVTANGTPTTRHGDYFRAEVGIDNGSGAAWEAITSKAVVGGATNLLSTITGNVFLPHNPESYSYDADGNLTQDGRWTYTWDGENRLINMTSLGSTPTASKFKLDFLYDYSGRRLQKLVSTNSGAGYVAQYTNRFVYDGWNLQAILNPQSLVTQSFLWGLDLSGSLQGAGGVGGLLRISSPVSSQFTCFDGNGNTIALIDSSSSQITSQYEYGPFGETTRLTGSAGSTNPFKFSTKYQDDETAMLYYGHRFYNPVSGRWLSKDPTGEIGADNLYSSFNNNAISIIDRSGLDNWYNPSAGQNSVSQASYVAFLNPSTGDNTGGHLLGVEWVTGLSDKSRLFAGHDKMATQMRNSPEAMTARARIRELLKCGCKVGLTVPFARSLGGEPKGVFYEGFLLDFFGRNPARAFLGSFSGTATIVQCFGGGAVVTFRLYDPAGWESATRLWPPYGYDKNRIAFFERPWTPVIFIRHWVWDGLHGRFDVVYVPHSILPDGAFGPFGGNIEVNITWTEYVPAPPSFRLLPP